MFLLDVAFRPVLPQACPCGCENRPSIVTGMYELCDSAAERYEMEPLRVPSWAQVAESLPAPADAHLVVLPWGEFDDVPF